MTLTPSPWLFLRTVLGSLVAIFTISYFWQGYHQGHWWSPDYIFSLSIPVLIIACVVWGAFVPLDFAVSEECLTIRFAFRRRRNIGWDKLRLWGSGGEATFLLKFANHGTFQVGLFAFPRSQRRWLKDFLASRFPQRKARGWLGLWGFP
jgi:hypothetical protein